MPWDTPMSHSELLYSNIDAAASEIENVNVHGIAIYIVILNRWVF